MKKQRITKEIEYPDAPCGYATMYNYKEPFMPFQDSVSREGYGYEGVLVFDGETDRVQCHFCGNWFHALGNHIRREHGLSAREYKDRVGLAQTTALIGETMREKLIASGQERFKNLRPGKKKTQAEKDKISATLKNRVRQYQNITGTCPLQLIERLQKKAEQLGRPPGIKDIIFDESCVRVFGSFNNAMEAAGLPILKPGQTRVRRQSVYTKEWFVKILRSIWIKDGKFPKKSDWERMFGKKTSAIYNRYLKIQKEVKKEVLFGEKVFHKTGMRIRASKEELLNILRDFIKTNDRNPSVSDCKRGLLPHASRYYYHFGSLKKALKQL